MRLHVSEAARAAETAASTSAALACAILMSGRPVAGLTLSKYSPPSGGTLRFPMTRCSAGAWRSSQSSAGAVGSRAGPYVMVSKMSAMLMGAPHRRVELSRHRMMVCRGVATADGMRELALDIREQAAGADTEKLRMQPGVAQLLLHERQPVERLPGRADAAGRLEADAPAGALVVVADGACHHQPDRQRGVDALLAGRGLDEVGAGHHADEARLADIAQGPQLAGGQDGLEMGRATRGAEVAHLVVERLPVAPQHVCARDDAPWRRAGARCPACRRPSVW